MKRFCEEKISLLFLSLRAVDTDQIAVFPREPYYPGDEMQIRSQFFQENRTIQMELHRES